MKMNSKARAFEFGDCRGVECGAGTGLWNMVLVAKMLVLEL